jgi:Dolichyl-phosphate-mannose-protein mannosyltransferase
MAFAEVRPSRWWGIPLLLLLTWGLGLRVWLATPDLNERRFWDERYQVENLRALLEDGRLHPVKGFYPGLSYLPQALPLLASEGLYRLTGRSSFAVFQEAEGMTPTGYFLCRLLQALAGTLSLYLTFRIGQRLFSPGVGLLAALLLAGVPWHLRQSVVFKPDILLTAMCLLAFERSLAAVEQPGRRSYLQAGSAIGLALASKLSAGPIAIPLMIAALTGGGWRSRRSWSLLVLAGAASVAVFLLLTPFFALDLDFYLEQNGNTIRSYAQKGIAHDSSHLSTFLAGLGTPLSVGYHGPWLGTLALLGLVAWVGLAVRSRGARGTDIPRLQRLGPGMAAGFVLAFILFYSIATTFPKGHNWLPLAPFTSLAAAWVLVRIWEAVAARLPEPRRRPAGVVVAVALALLLAIPATSSTYRSVIPTTHELARKVLLERIEPQPGRAFVLERGDAPPLSRPGRSGVLLRIVESLDGVAPRSLDGADAELFLAARLDGPQGAFYRSRLAAAGAETLRIAPAPFYARGPELVLLLHPWEIAGEAHPLPLARQAARGSYAGRLPDGVPPGEMVSLEVVLLPGWRPTALRKIALGGRPVDWDAVGREGRRPRYYTQRFPATGEPVTVAIGRPLPPGKSIKVLLRRWQRRAGGV